MKNIVRINRLSADKGVRLALEMVKLNYLAEQMQGNKATNITKIGAGANHNIHNGKPYYYKQSDVEVLQRIMLDTGMKLMQVRITQEPQSETDSPCCYGDDFISKFKVLRKIICLPYLFTKVMGRTERWQKMHLSDKADIKYYNKFTDSELEEINAGIRTIAHRLCSIQLEYQTPPGTISRAEKTPPTVTNIEDQFNRIAKEYDKNRRLFIPCFDGFYEETTRFIAANMTFPKRILDLGAGTGLLSQFWFQHFPSAEYVLVDVADEMLNVAKRRFEGVNNVEYCVMDYSKCFPQGSFDVIMSALSIHHLEDEEKRQLFVRIYEALSVGGVFVNYDQFCADSEEINRWYNTYWEGQLSTSGLTDDDLALWRERKNLDRECSVEKELAMLSTCPFREIKCVYSNQKFAVLVAIK